MKRFISLLTVLTMLLSMAIVPSSAADGVLLSDDFQSYEEGASISGKNNWILRSNTDVTATVKKDGTNKYLEFSRMGSANGALRWDFSSYVANIDTYTVSYKMQIPSAYRSNMGTNISISATEAGSNGPCIAITNDGVIKYFNTDGTQSIAKSEIVADTWVDVIMVVDKANRKAQLFIDGEFITDVYPRSSSEQLTMLSVFMSSKVQAMRFDDFELSTGETTQIECDLKDSFESYEVDSGINGQGRWNLRTNTGVAAVVESDGSNKYLRMTRSASANGALLWDFSPYVADVDLFTVAYKLMIPEDEYSNAGVNISISNDYAVSTGPCVNITADGLIKYFTGNENEMLLVMENAPADKWINVKMVINKADRKAKLYVDNTYIDDITPRNATVTLDKLSIFMSTTTQSILFDDFKLSAGADINESVEDLIAAGKVTFTDADGEVIEEVPYSGTVNAVFTVDNILEDTKDIAVALAVYDENDTLLLLDREEITVKATDVTEVEVSVSAEDLKGCYAELFVWDEKMVPLREAKGLEARPLLWLPSVFDDDAVLQRDTELNIWGEAVPGGWVTVEIDDKEYKTTVASDGSWRVTADAISVEKNPYTMTVSAEYGEPIVYENLLAGEVWLCSGQSNMEWSLTKADGGADEIANADYPEIRLFTQTKNGTTEVQKDVTNGRWKVCSLSTVQNFSAVGYLFGKELHEQIDVPVGLIYAAYGGARMEAFVSEEALTASSLTECLDYVSITDMKRSATRLYNAMIAPLIPYNLKGCIWYQGCANIGVYDEYHELSKIMLDDWRSRWGQEDMPFIITQLAAYGREDVENVEFYPYLREAQLNFAQDETLDNVGMAVVLESGEKDNIHPTDKHTPAHRLALVAEGMVYGMDVEYMYPSPVSYEVHDKTISVHFKDVYDGLECGGDTLDSFEIMDAEGNWYAASAEISGTDVVNVTDCEHVPVAVRCGFAPYPDPMVNLYNSAGLLVTPFRIGDYE